MKKQKLKYGLLFAVVLGITLFIFGNSFLSYDMSHTTSNSVSEMILPDKYSDSETVLTLIRKAAHLVEYAALGFAVMLLVRCIEKDFRKRMNATAFFYVLFVAVLDEHIQSFSDRSSSTGDILLDFFGSVMGFAAFYAIHFIYNKWKVLIKRKRQI